MRPQENSKEGHGLWQGKGWESRAGVGGRGTAQKEGNLPGSAFPGDSCKLFYLNSKTSAFVAQPDHRWKNPYLPV